MSFQFDAARLIARSAVGRAFIHLLFRRLHWLLPVDYLHQTATILAFYHPKPSYKVHILIVPRDPIDNLTSLPLDDTALLHDIFETVQILVDKLKLERYRLICNGGAYQDIPHLHFHLVAD
ncbi:MAG: HIT domain-containing protein [Chloroflexi bacterium]|nr:HIT domain-containing protein [Chloroflexota bacterium]